MKVILNQNVENLGHVGDVVNVKGGYARNFLLPRGLGMIATKGNKAAVDHHLRVLEKKKVEMLAEAKKTAASIEKISITVSKQVGEDEKIFGSVTTAELEEMLAKEGVKLSKKNIRLSEDIKKVGVYTAEAKVHPEVTAKFKVWVVAQ